jgi:hypothetical protein
MNANFRPKPPPASPRQRIALEFSNAYRIIAGLQTVTNGGLCQHHDATLNQGETNTTTGSMIRNANDQAGSHSNKNRTPKPVS